MLIAVLWIQNCDITRNLARCHMTFIIVQCIMCRYKITTSSKLL